ncbi:acetyl-CoA carboxylase biotin carboxylase subunit family protein [Streptomyces sp. NPDC101158]|uniref:ATP-grasp domain-containing protein n=1 Tax=Streptomyces sp. NPDC101158 TaxID=3366117 RepID=UPI0037F9C22E
MKKILFVHARGGVPLDHALPRLAACGEVHMLALSALSADRSEPWRRWCADVIEAGDRRIVGEELVDLVVASAKEVGADAVIGFSEYILLALAHAAERLGLPGPGAGAVYSRDKRLMRERWAEAGVPVPAFRRVATEAELAEAFDALTAPMLLKPAWGAGSIGQAVLRTRDDVAGAWSSVTGALRGLADRGFGESYETDAPGHLLVEEIIDATTEGWYEEEGYGDYLSVEGVVARGVFHPVAITGRIPTIAPFTELSSHAPCVLAEPLQRRVEEVARAAVDALGLDTCGTHTEIKLCRDGGLMVVESAARFGGSAIMAVVEEVFGADLVTMLTRELLGEPAGLPERMLVEGGRGAAAEMSLIGTDAAGRPWTTTPVWDARTADLDLLVSPGSHVEPVRSLTVPDGTPIPAYDAPRGITNCAGMLFLTSPDPGTLLRDTYAVLDGMEARLNDAATAAATTAAAAGENGA